MFFKSNTKIVVTTVKIASEEDLTKLTFKNSAFISGLSGYSVNTNTTPTVFSDGFNTMDSNARRGIYTEPGTSVTYTLSLTTYIGANELDKVNNSILFAGMVSNDTTSIYALDNDLLNTGITGQGLNELSIIIISNNYCKVYYNAVVDGLSLSLQLSELLYGTWSILAGSSLELYGLAVEKLIGFGGHTEYYEVYREELVEYFPNKRMVVKTTVPVLGTLMLPPVSGALSFSNGVVLTPSTAMEDFGQYYGHKAGSQTISGQFAVYLKAGSIADLAAGFAELYFTGENGVVVPLALQFKTAEKTLEITIGNVLIDMPNTNYDRVFISEFKFTAINYYSSDFKVRVV